MVVFLCEPEVYISNLKSQKTVTNVACHKVTFVCCENFICKYICLLLKVKFSSIENHASSKVNKLGGLTQPHSVFPIKTIRNLLVCLLISSKCILLVRWPSLILLIAIQPAILPPAHVMHLKSVIHIRHRQLTRQACHNYMLHNFPSFQ